jgi:predicted TIM-barrel fold metal-dependent hydrolase
MLARIGASRAIVVQPAPYATDASALLNALDRARGALRGVAVAGSDVSDQALDRMHDAGVRGLRFSEVLDSGTGRRFAGSVGVDQLQLLAPRIAARGWHAQIWARCEDVGPLVEALEPLGVPLVFEHMTTFTVERGVNDAAFQRVLGLVGDSRIQVKLALCRVSKAAPGYEDVRPFHDALVQANPRQLLWASDWPFVRMGDRSPDVGHLLDVFHAWVDDEPIRRAILVENPARLYGFGEA